jgi:hypothetical protein
MFLIFLIFLLYKKLFLIKNCFFKKNQYFIIPKETLIQLLILLILKYKKY